MSVPRPCGACLGEDGPTCDYPTRTNYLVGPRCEDHNPKGNPPMATFDIMSDPDIRDAYIRWSVAKDRTDAAAEEEKSLAAALKERLRAELPDGAQLIGAGGQLVATWTRNNATNVDVAGLLAANSAAFYECAKAVAVDPVKLAKNYPALAEQFVTKTASDVYTVRRA